VTAVLVVEDEPLTRLSISEVLAEAGYVVLTAGNADQAIEILEARTDIRTVFTDIDMPGSMNGLKLAAAVRNKWPPINLIITTGMSRPLKSEMPENSVFIPKPYRPGEVVDAFRRFN